ncbi:KpsF/GutQ family sugar-phosphate isomerase [Pseudoalteromonas sp. Z9A4]|uniref:KpsF/GutQ family sugar-phosphate isomerase n=1 Tax=Pseudoalteromonas sp. Z9A4 TaxID=2686353 RepID=UPI001408FF02|nr:KpsF/GutQ family sugar-phosphate isomerase [Pseudoalteromonas sp. Z9A4]
MFLKIANEVIENEIQGIREVQANLDDEFEKLITFIAQSSGRVVMCGMGKSGHIAKKIFATLVSTGTPSMFMHPAEAFHGDLGMIKSEDVFFTISNSGETPEVTQLLPFIKANGNTLVAMTGDKNSTLGLASDYHISIGVSKEACLLNLAPTTSTTVSLVIGDAIAISLMTAKNFKAENFAQYHPGGSLGRKLLLTVKDVCRNPIFANESMNLIEVLQLMAEHLAGLVVVGSENNCLGIITDGDIRKFLMNTEHQSIRDIKAHELMTKKPYAIPIGTKCAFADLEMERLGINSLLVESNNNIVGVYDNLNRNK